MRTGENEQGLKQVIDLTRAISITLLLVHFYYYCYHAFQAWHVTSAITDRVLKNLFKTGLFRSFNTSKAIALGFLALSVLGATGKKEQHYRWRTVLFYIGTGLLLYFAGYWIIYLPYDVEITAISYMVVTATGYLLCMAGGSVIVRMLRVKLSGEVSNKHNETFPQEERLVQNEYSVNLPARYNLKGRMRNSFVNIPNPFRGLLILGTPGSGKSVFIIHEIIRQHIQKGFAMFIYDYKMPDLTKLAYNLYLQYRHAYTVPPSFYVIDFDNIQDRCNPIHPGALNDPADAAESARSFLLGLNKEWIRKQGDFWVESPVNFLTAVIWFLRRYEDGRYCTIPHAMEMVQQPYDKLFSVLRTEPQIELLLSPFINAYQNGAVQQLEGQLAGVSVSLGRLSSPNLYYVLTGNDFTLDINNPLAPKIVCVGNSPQKASVYGAVMSLYFTTMARLVNRRGGIKSSIVMDEFTTLYVHGVDTLLATARSNKVALTLALQDGNQLRLHYGKEMADVLINLPGNIICGQNSGDLAKQLSERLGKILQDRESLSVNGGDTNITRSKQLELAVPPSTIAGLSSGEFVGLVADSPDQKIALKTFHAELITDFARLEKEQTSYVQLPLKAVTQKVIQAHYMQVKQEVKNLMASEIQYMMDNPELAGLIVSK